MTETERQGAADIAAGDGPPEIGARLHAARVARDLALEQAAAELGLDPRTLAALEADDYDFLGAPVFVRAHLSRYATLLELDAETLVADYVRHAQHTPTLPPPARRREPISVGGDGGRWPWIVGAAAVVALVGYASWRVLESVEAPQPVAATTTAPAMPAGSAPEAAPRERDRTTSRAGDVDVALAPVIPRVARRDAVRGTGASEDTAVPAPAVASSGDPVADDAAPVQVAGALSPPPLADDADGVRVEIEFSDECWTEITDAVGRRLYFGLGQAGETARLRGEPPLQVLLGDTSAVRLRVDGETYPLPDGNGQVTRLQLASRGEP